LARYGNYFAANASEAPLLHTWSLGVEEQFYLIWPLFILLLVKISRYAAGALAFLTLGAIALSQFGTGIVASASYYLLPARFFELMIGGLLALAPARKHTVARNSGLCSILGFALIGVGVFWLNKESPFPGANALWPCLGTALLIWAGKNSRAASPWILTCPPMAFLGLISYSLYLCHWPIIACLN
jgi:peptidoglycan/LPS O-acetylase OafA/YrhL